MPLPAPASGRRRSRSVSCGPPLPVRATEGRNAYVCPIDKARLDALRHTVENLKPGPSKSEMLFKPKRWRFHVEKPSWGKTDIEWISSADEHTFRSCFEPLFQKLCISELFRFLGGDGGLTLFSGFVVARQSTRKSNFHTDFSDTGAKCFTLSKCKLLLHPWSLVWHPCCIGS